MTTATVVGSGPNGLSAAIRLAQAGVAVTVLEAEPTIGGGARTAELTLPGVLHDVCSTAMPGVMSSPFLRTLNLERHGLRWRRHEAALAHPLDDGTAALLWQDVSRTAQGLGADGAAYHLEALTQAMTAHRYDVQSAVYLLALHRLLRQRLQMAPAMT